LPGEGGVSRGAEGGITLGRRPKDNQPRLGESAAAPGEGESATTPGEGGSAGAPYLCKPSYKVK
jgi:hypothetical protein